MKLNMFFLLMLVFVLATPVQAQIVTAGKPTVAVVLEATDLGLLSVSDMFFGELSSPRVKFVAVLLTKSEVDQLYNGNQTVAKRVLGKFSQVLVAKLRLLLRPSATTIFEDGKVCDFAISYRVLDTGGIGSAGVIVSIGPGFTEAQALKEAVSRAAIQMSNKF